MPYKKFNDIGMGSSAQFEAVVDEKKMQAFLELSGDTNPLHTNAEFAMARGFSGRVVYGMLSASFYSTLVGVYLPGERALLQGMDIQFNKPVSIGDKLSVFGEVTYINDVYQQIELSAHITNQHGKKISKAKIKVGFL